MGWGGWGRGGGGRGQGGVGGWQGGLRVEGGGGGGVLAERVAMGEVGWG